MEVDEYKVDAMAIAVVALFICAFMRDIDGKSQHPKIEMALTALAVIFMSPLVVTIFIRSITG